MDIRKELEVSEKRIAAAVIDTQGGPAVLECIEVTVPDAPYVYPKYYVGVIGMEGFSHQYEQRFSQCSTWQDAQVAWMEASGETLPEDLEESDEPPYHLLILCTVLMLAACLVLFGAIAALPFLGSWGTLKGVGVAFVMAACVPVCLWLKEDS